MERKPPVSTLPTLLTSVALVIAFLFIPGQLCAQTTDTLKVTWYGSHEVLSEQSLLKFVPIELAEYHPDGRTDTLHRFVAQVWPMSDSAGIMFDSATLTPDYILVLYNTVDSKLVLLKREETGYALQWTSNKLIGEMGFIKIQDLNHDGEMEIVVDLQIVPRMRPNIFIYEWNGGRPRDLYPSGFTAGFSAFSVNVNFTESDTGLTIKTIRSGNESTYFYGKNSSEIRLISESPTAQKE